MDVLTGLIGLLMGASVGCLVTWRWAAAERSRLRAGLGERVTFWQSEAERARASAAQAAERTAAWVAGCEQGREDLLSLARALAQHGTRADQWSPLGPTDLQHPAGDEEAAGWRTTARSG
jgi:hypothetical protein